MNIFKEWKMAWRERPGMTILAIVLVIFVATAMALLIPIHQPAFPGTDWTRVWTTDSVQVYCLATFNDQLYAGTGKQIYSYDGNSWSQVSNFTSSFSHATQSLVVWQNHLYAATSGANVLRYDGGKTWTAVNEAGFGDPGFSDWPYGPYCLTVYDSGSGPKLYCVINGNGGKFQVWKYSGSDTTWARVDTEAWGWYNRALCAASFDGYLWVGTENESTGAEVWRYNGSWSKANQNGFGKSDRSCLTFGVNQNQLYAGTGNSPTRGKVYHYNSGTSWSQVNQNGFGSDYNYTVSSLASYKGKLFAGTFRRNFEPGCQVWSYDDSSWTWTQENQNGFGDVNNLDATSMAVFQDNLYVGTFNSNGAQVWRTAPTPKPYSVYLAEGSTAWGFDCYISVENPQTFPVTVALTYQTNTGPVAGPQFVMAAKSQATINPRDTLGNQDFSTKIKCLDGKLIAADRTMIWNRCGEEGHNSIGVTAPAKTWYLAEGSSEWGFECWLLIQNPNASEASCNVTYMIEGRGPVTVNKKVPANSRKTFFMADDIGSADASIKVVSNLPVIPERAMYRNNRREGHDSIGTTTPAQDYYLAEGTSAWGFTTYVLVQNPNNSVTSVTVTYMTKDGPVGQAPFNMPPNSRKTIRVNDVLPNVDFSTKVHGNQPIIAERAMYWNNGTGEACHDSIGMNQPHTSFYLPDGQTSNGRETWTLVQNPNNQAVTVEISYLTPNGAGNVVFTDTIPANSRRTYNMVDKGVGGRAAVTVRSLTSGKKIMVERAMYWNARGAGTDTIGGFSD